MIDRRIAVHYSPIPSKVSHDLDYFFRKAASMKLFRVLAIAWLAVLASGVRGDEELFRAKIAPIFERHCLSCHEGSKPKGGLSLANAAKAMLGGESGALIVPG